MGLFKSVKKLVGGFLKSPLATLAGFGLSAALGPAGFGFSRLAAGAMGGAASLLLSGAGKKGKRPKPADVPDSPLAGGRPLEDFPTRQQQVGQIAEGGDVASSYLLSDVEDDEVKKRTAARTLLG